MYFAVDSLRMAKRRFDSLPASDDSDPALISHRALPADARRHDAAGNGALKPLNGDVPVDDGDDLRCGLGRCFSPDWLQALASKQMFLAVFCLACVLQGMFFTYFVSVLTTIEKLFQIQSKTTGIIMSATEMGQIGGALLLTYYGGQGHRPKWIGWGMVLFGASAALCSLPHFLFWRTKPITGGMTSETLLDAPSPAQLEMDLVCRSFENATSFFDNQLKREEHCNRKLSLNENSISFLMILNAY